MTVDWYQTYKICKWGVCRWITDSLFLWNSTVFTTKWHTKTTGPSVQEHLCEWMAALNTALFTSGAQWGAMIPLFTMSHSIHTMYHTSNQPAFCTSGEDIILQLLLCKHTYEHHRASLIWLYIYRGMPCRVKMEFTYGAHFKSSEYVHTIWYYSSRVVQHMCTMTSVGIKSTKEQESTVWSEFLRSI